MKEKIENFKKLQKKLHAYEHAHSMLYFDALTAMPKGAFSALGDTIEILTEEKYKIETAKETVDLVNELYENRDNLDFITKREAEEFYERQYKLSKIPMEEYVAYQVTLNDASAAWEKAKLTNDYELFAPHLEKIIAYQKNYIKYLETDELKGYDVLLNDYEKGFTVEVLDEFFNKIKEEIIPIIKKVSQIKDNEEILEGTFDINKQKELSDYLMDVIGLDKNHCAITETEHPFTIEFSKDDVRITTHYHEDSLASNIYSVVHEGGHAMYELGIGDNLRNSVLAHGVSMGIHESQSRFWENLIGRSLPFIKKVYPKIQELFPEKFANVSAEDFYRAVNFSKPGLIRIEADELTYSIHVLIRYEIEKMIFSDKVTVADLPRVWNELYKEYLGVDVPNNSQGVLQDTHWSGGSFGYFPSYSLGSAYASQIVKTMEKEIPVWESVEKGELSVVRNWLIDKIYQHGCLYTPAQLIENICGEKFTAQYYIDYLKEKFTDLYNL